MHVDPGRARRTVFGFPVVHGVHVVLWALDCFLRQRNSPRGIAALRANFGSPIPLDTLVTVSVLSEDQHSCRLSIDAAGEQLFVVRVTFSSATHSSPRTFSAAAESQACVELDAAQASTAAGQMRLILDDALLHRILPTVRQCLPAVQIAELLATTRLVGMQCPGLHSLFVSLNLTERQQPDHKQPDDSVFLSFNVKRGVPFVGIVDLAVTGPTLNGVLETIVRPKPQPQPSMADIRAVMPPSTFQGQIALVVGGSRGLGEVTAKCIAAGGGSVIITYSQGRQDADRVVDEITAAGGPPATALRLDCTQLPPDLAQYFAAFGAPTHLFYFATPKIPVNKNRIFHSATFNTLSRYYVEAFSELVEAVYRPGKKLTVLYPSTIFLDEPKPGTGEYCAAKAAGEALCRHLEKVLPNTRFLTPRLPRVRTDQTTGFLPSKSREPLDAMLGILKQMEP